MARRKYPYRTLPPQRARELARSWNLLVIALGRLSGAAQVGEKGENLDAQDRTVRRRLREEGFNEPTLYVRAVVSGREVKNRDDLASVADRIESGELPRSLVVWPKIARFARDGEIAWTYLNRILLAGSLVWFVGDDVLAGLEHGWEAKVGFGVTEAQKESTELGERLRDRNADKKAENGALGKAPWGYEYHPNDKNQWIPVHAEDCPSVRRPVGTDEVGRTLWDCSRVWDVSQCRYVANDGPRDRGCPIRGRILVVERFALGGVTARALARELTEAGFHQRRTRINKDTSDPHFGQPQIVVTPIKESTIESVFRSKVLIGRLRTDVHEENPCEREAPWLIALVGQDLWDRASKEYHRNATPEGQQRSRSRHVHVFDDLAYCDNLLDDGSTCGVRLRASGHHGNGRRVGYVLVHPHNTGCMRGVDKYRSLSERRVSDALAARLTDLERRLTPAALALARGYVDWLQTQDQPPGRSNEDIEKERAEIRWMLQNSKSTGMTREQAMKEFARLDAELRTEVAPAPAAASPDELRGLTQVWLGATEQPGDSAQLVHAQREDRKRIARQLLTEVRIRLVPDGRMNKPRLEVRFGIRPKYSALFLAANADAGHQASNGNGHPGPVGHKATSRRR